MTYMAVSLFSGVMQPPPTKLELETTAFKKRAWGTTPATHHPEQ